jgi:two-component system, OmpR family, phosphate regulon sensor histidine kinase PhoR
MPRTRLFWHLFVGWCAAVLVTLAAGFWIATVQFAGLADDALAARLTDSARALVATLPGADPTADREGFRQAAAALERASGIRCTLASGDGPAEGTASRSRYDGATGRRSLEVAVPAGTSLVLAAADATQSDDALARWQRRLLGGCIAVAACAAALGSAVVWRVTKPVDELVATAERLVAGDTAAEVPATEVAEFADLASALVRLREQLVERGLTIGRQGTQQEAVLGSMIEGVLAIDARQRLLGVNQAAAELLGIDPGRAAGRPLQDVIRNPDLRRFALTAIDCREPVEDDLVLHGLRDRTIRMRGTALRDASGDGGAVLVLNDVTEMQRLERVRRDFVANVSHELKTPIASIKGFVETLLDGALEEPDDARRFLGIVARQADRLAAIIEDLLALSRIEQSEGTGNLPRDEAPVAGVLQAAVGDCQPRASDRGVALEVTCPGDLAWRVNAPLLEQAVINLVDNAIKYSAPGDTVRLVAAVEPSAQGELAIRVEDDGCGIAAEHLPRLFERFYRVDKARSRGLGGTGLGLSIVKHIVQAHHGSVAVESEPGRGTCFTIRLPSA